MNFIIFHSEKNFIISGVCLSGICIFSSLSCQEFVFPEFVFQEFVMTPAEGPSIASEKKLEQKKVCLNEMFLA